MLNGVTLQMLTLPQNNMSKYYRYSGSLTTPDCAQAVVWTVFEDRIPLSKTQVPNNTHNTVTPAYLQTKIHDAGFTLVISK